MTKVSVATLDLEYVSFCVNEDNEEVVTEHLVSVITSQWLIETGLSPEIF